MKNLKNKFYIFLEKAKLIKILRIKSKEWNYIISIMTKIIINKILI